MSATEYDLVIGNGRVLFPDGRITTADVAICGTVIGDVGDGVQSTTSVIDVSGCYVLPGLVDLHTHGIGREAASTGSLESYAALCASFGATTVYPTLFASPAELVEQMSRHLSETGNLRRTPQIGGFRLESPYIARTGAGVTKDLSPIGRETTQMLLKAGRGHVKIWDVSPELPGCRDEIELLCGEGIVTSIAHTQATPEEARAAVDAGARLVTHLFDTFVPPEMTDPGVYPAGLVDYLLIEDRVACEIIGDGTHVHPFLVEKAFRCKGEGGLVFVTDSNLGAGLPPGRYELPGGWGNVVIQSANHGVRLVDRDMALAGSALTPIDAFRNGIQLFGKDIAAASRVCSTNPARLMGLNKGEIAAGMDADIIVLDQNLQLLYTVAQGRVVYKR